jgi:hypothetical protein
VLQRLSDTVGANYTGEVMPCKPLFGKNNSRESCPQGTFRASIEKGRSASINE